MRAPAHHLILGAPLAALFLACKPGAPPAAPVAPPPAAPVAPPPAFWVAGNEPFWAIQIDSTGLRYRTPEDTTGVRFPPTAPTVRGDTLRWAGRGERDTFDILIWKGECSDGMSDRVWTYTATVIIGGTSYRGCARE